MHSGLCEVEACQWPTGVVCDWKLVLSLPGPVPSLSAHPCWHHCLRLQGGASASSCGCKTNPLPTLPGKPKELKSNPVLFHYPAAYCELRMSKTHAHRKVGKVWGLLLFNRGEFHLKYMLKHSSSSLLNGSCDSTVVKVTNMGDREKK